MQVQPDGDNSKDSTDSHTSASSGTRASRLRTKQQAALQQQEDEPMPVRETRRKAMLKERVSIVMSLPLFTYVNECFHL